MSMNKKCGSNSGNGMTDGKVLSHLKKDNTQHHKLL